MILARVSVCILESRPKTLPLTPSIDPESVRSAAIFLKPDESNTSTSEPELSIIYRGVLERDFASIDVVCKMMYGKKSKNRLRCESTCYEHLREAKGKIIPTCCGPFKSEMDDDSIVYVLLEYGSTSMCCVLQRMEWDYEDIPHLG